MKKKEYLIAISSTSQMYSGTGRIILDWISYAKEKFTFTFLMDNSVEENFLIAKVFCEKNGIKFIESGCNIKDGLIDSGVEKISQLRKHFDIIEMYSWANGSTNSDLIKYAKRKRNETVLCFSPFGQPIETLINHEKYYNVDKVFAEAANESDCIFILSSKESDLTALKPHKNSGKLHLITGAVDIDKFKINNSIERLSNTILVACDCREKRKRVDLILKAFAHVANLNDSINLIICGKSSDKLQIPANLKERISLLGYVEESDLIALYQKSCLYLSLAEYEAFCLPIAEALCCGTPALIPDNQVMRNIFSGLEGINFINPEDSIAVAKNIIRIINSDIDREIISRTAFDSFSLSNIYKKKYEVIDKQLNKLTKPIIKILHFTPKYYSNKSVIGGGEKYVNYLSKAIKLSNKYNYVCDTISLSNEEFTEKNKCGIFKTTNIIGENHYSIERFNELYDLIGKYDIVVVHQCFSKASLIFASLSKLCRKYIIGMDQGGGECEYINEDAAIANVYDSFIAYSSFGKNTLMQYRPPVYLIKGPVDNLFFRPLTQKQKTTERYFLSIGRILPHKGYENIIKAISKDDKLKIVGQPYDEKYLEYLKKLAQEEGVDLELIFNASDYDVRLLLNNCKAYIHSSVHIDVNGRTYQKPELLGLAPLEALACGKTSIVSNAGSLDELGEIEGCYVYNTISELKEHLMRIDNHAQDRQKISSSLAKVYGLTRFSRGFDSIIDQWKCE